MTTENKKSNWQDTFKINQIAEWYSNNRRNANVVLVGLIALVAGFIYYQKSYKPNLEKEAAGVYIAKIYLDRPMYLKIIKK